MQETLNTYKATLRTIESIYFGSLDEKAGIPDFFRLWIVGHTAATLREPLRRFCLKTLCTIASGPLRYPFVRIHR